MIDTLTLPLFHSPTEPQKLEADVGNRSLRVALEVKKGVGGQRRWTEFQVPSCEALTEEITQDGVLEASLSLGWMV